MNTGSDSNIIVDKLMNTRGGLCEKKTCIGQGNKRIIMRKPARNTFSVTRPVRIREERTGMNLRSAINLVGSEAQSCQYEYFRWRYSEAGLGQDQSKSEDISFPDVNRRVSLQLFPSGRYALPLRQIHKIPHTPRLTY